MCNSEAGAGGSGLLTADPTPPSSRPDPVVSQGQRSNGKSTMVDLPPEKQPRPAALLRLHRQQVVPVEGGRAARHPVFGAACQHLHLQQCVRATSAVHSGPTRCRWVLAARGYPPPPAPGKASTLVCLLQRLRVRQQLQTAWLRLMHDGLRALASVVLPLPLRPISAAASPACTARVTPCRAVEEWDRAHEWSVLCWTAVSGGRGRVASPAVPQPLGSHPPHLQHLPPGDGRGRLACCGAAACRCDSCSQLPHVQ